MSLQHSPSATKCRIAELVQYNCEIEQTAGSIPQVHCFPFPRLFRICPGRPAVEITRLVRIDMSTGEVDIPPEVSDTLPKAKPWRDVVRYVEAKNRNTDQ